MLLALFWLSLVLLFNLLRFFPRITLDRSPILAEGTTVFLWDGKTESLGAIDGHDESGVDLDLGVPNEAGGVARDHHHSAHNAKVGIALAHGIGILGDEGQVGDGLDLARKELSEL